MNNFYESFLCEQQSDEIIPEEYDDWCKWMYDMAGSESHQQDS